MKQVPKKLFYLLLLPAVWGVCAWQGWAWWSWVSSPLQVASAVEDPRISIKIPAGTTGQQIGQDLEAAGLIRSATAWNLWARWQAFQDKLGGFQAGTYHLSPTESLEEVGKKIWNGDVVEVSFTIPEGWTIADMATYFESQGFFPAQEFLATASQIPTAEYPWLPSNLPHLEGFLFPDTYQLIGDQIIPTAVIRQMLNGFEQQALPVYQGAENTGQLTLLEWVTFASIVEKEAVVKEERGVIAGVFRNRLVQGMPLGADPTVEYGLGIRQTQEKPLTLTQVRTPSPYNTYLNPGLPPTAIGSPGLASLKAALNPEKTEYLYFMARYDGTHIFSKTAAEHEAAIAEVERQLSLQ